VQKKALRAFPEEIIFLGSHIFVEVVLLKKLLAVSLFVLVALFAASSAFALPSNPEVNDEVIGLTGLPSNVAQETEPGYPTYDQFLQLFKADDQPGVGKYVANNGPEATHVIPSVASKLAAEVFSRVDSATLARPFIWESQNFKPDFKPAGTEPVPHGGVIMVAYPLESAYNGKKVSEIAAVKVLGEKKKEQYTMVFSAAEFKDKTSAVVRKAWKGPETDNPDVKWAVLGNDAHIGDIGPAPEHNPVSGKLYARYYIVLCVKDNGDFDSDTAGGVVVEPGFVVAANPIAGSANITGLPDGTAQPAYGPLSFDIWQAGNTNKTLKELTDVKFTDFRYLKPGILSDLGHGSDKVLPLPSFQVSGIKSLQTAVVLFVLGDTFEGMKVADLKAAKVVLDADGKPEQKDFTPVFDPKDLKDGCFAVVVDDSDEVGFDKQTVLSKDTVLEKGKLYYIALAIADNGAFDLDKTGAQILDPCFAYAVSTPDPEKPVEPVTPAVEGLPEGVAPMKNPVAVFDDAAATGLGADAQKALGDQTKAKQFFVKDSLRESVMKRDGLTSPAFSAPVFKGEVTEGTIGLVMFPLTGFNDKKVSDVKALKVLNDTAADAVAFKQVYAAKDLADGTFAVVKNDKKTIRAAGETVAADDYILLAIKDGGKFDLNPAKGVISDPSFAACPPATPQPTPSGSSGGGCSVGGFAPAALLLVAPLFLLLKK